LLNNIDIDPDEHYFSKQPNSCRYSTPTENNPIAVGIAHPRTEA